MGSFEYLEDEAIADIAFRAYGDDLQDLFYHAAMATANLQTDINLLPRDEQRDIHIHKSDIDRLLKAFLDEILFYKDAELIFAVDFEVHIEKTVDGYLLDGKLIGGKFDYDIHPMHTDLKAITWHDFKVTKSDAGWQCYVLIDI